MFFIANSTQESSMESLYADVHVCLNDPTTCMKILRSPPVEAQGILIAFDPALPYSPQEAEEMTLRLLKSFSSCRQLTSLTLPRISPVHAPIIANYSSLTHLSIGKVNLFVAVHILTMCTSLQSVEFKLITYSTKQSMPPLLYDRQLLKAMKSIRIHDAQCHFMDLLHHFACPGLEILDVTNNRIQCSVGEQLQWFLSCETAFTDFLLDSASNLKELAVFDDNESDPLDVGLAETLHYVYNQILRHSCALEKVCLPRLTEMPFKHNGFKFLHDLRDAISLLSQELPVDRVMDPPPPAPGVIRAYIHDAVRVVVCPRPREEHVPLAKDHSTNIMPKGYVFACDDCPQKTRNEKSILAIRMFAELADFHYDIRIGDRIVLNC